MNVDSLVNNYLVSTGKGKIADAYQSITSSSSINMMLNSLKDYKDKLLLSLPAYESFIECFSGIQEIADVVIDKTKGLGSEVLHLVQLTEEDAQMVFSCFKTMLSTLTDSITDVLQLTTESGLRYVIQVNDFISGNIIEYVLSSGEKIALLKRTAEGYFLDAISYAYNFNPIGLITTPLSNNIYSKLQRMCDLYNIIPEQPTVLGILRDCADHVNLTYESTDCVEDLIYGLCAHYDLVHTGIISNDLSNLLTHIQSEEVLPSYTTAKEALISLVDSIAQSRAINKIFVDVINNLRNNRFTAFLSQLKDTYNDARRSIKIIVNNITTAFNQGGYKGVISFIISSLKTLKSAKLDDDGLFVYTDNAALMPKVYLSGIVNTAVAIGSALIAAVGYIINPAIGVIASALSTIGYGIFQSFIGDYAATRSSLIVPYDELDELNQLNCAPISLFQGVCAIEPSNRWISNLLATSSGVGYLCVPGGTLLLGPGSYNSSGEIDSYRYEFHPYANLLDDPESCFGVYHYHNHPGIIMRRREDIIGDWEEFITSAPSHILYDVGNEPDGSLTVDNDAKMRHVISCAIITFVMFLLDYHPTFHDPDLYTSFKISTVGTDFERICYGLGAVPHPDIASWDTIISYCNDQSSGNYSYTLEVWEYRTTSEPEYDYVQILGKSPHQVASSILVNNGYYSGTVFDCGLQFKYAINVPKYSASSFWFTLISSVVGAGIIVAGAALLTFKFNRWKLRKRADNVAKFNSAQSDYQDAVNGQKTVYNEQTGKYETQHFDPNSSEGKAYINQCFTNYRKTAKRNNLWSNIIGGTKFDVGTFYGQAEDSEPTSSSSIAGATYTSLMDLLENTEDVNHESQLIDQNKILRLISGSED